ncbi:putative peroxidase [Escherichia coli]|nr:putative peroxidase [Escherichia coli]
MAVIKEGVDAGGSYVFVQRWEHNLKQLNRMSVHDQEMMIGRTKEANEEIDGDERPETSHLTRVDLKEDGKGLKLFVRACRTAPPAARTVCTSAPTAHVCITLSSNC